MKSIRVSLGVTQKDIAEVLCIHEFSVSRFERGTLNPSGPVQMIYRELAGGWKPRRLQTILLKKKQKEEAA